MKKKNFTLITIGLLLLECFSPLAIATELHPKEIIKTYEEEIIEEKESEDSTEETSIEESTETNETEETSITETFEDNSTLETEEETIIEEEVEEKEDRLITNKNSGVIDDNQSSVTWRFEEDGTLFLSGGHLQGYDLRTTFRLSRLLEQKIVEKVTTIYIEDTIVLFNGMDELFSGFTNLSTIINFKYLDGTQATSARYLFLNTPNLTHLDWSNQTISFTKMNSMFEDSDIQSVNFTNLSLPITTDMSRLFQGATSLSQLDLNGLNAPKITRIDSFITNTPNLKSLNLENQTLYLPKMDSMFAGSCIESANLNNLQLPLTTSLDSLFYNSTLNHITMNGINGPKVVNTSSMFLTTPYLKNIDWSNHTIKLKSLKSMFSGSQVESVNFNNLSLPIATDISSLFASSKNLTSITMDGFSAPSITSATGANEILAYTTSLTHLDWSNHTINIKNADKFFFNSKLVSLNLTNFKMPITTSTKYFFGTVPSLKILEIDGFTAPNSMNNWYWFGNVGIETIDWSHHTLNIPSTKYMFQRAKLTSVNLNNIQLPIVKEFDFMFSNMNTIQTISMTDIYTPNLKTTTNMFKDSSNLTDLELSFSPEVELTHTNSMFNTLSNIETLDISTINIEKSLNVIDMFAGMTSLRSLTLGERTVLEPSVALPEAARTINGDILDGFTGKWQTIGTGTIEEPNGKWEGTSRQLITKSREKVKQTYVWGMPPKVIGAGEIELLHFPSSFDFGASNSSIKSDQIIETKSKEHVVVRELRGMTSETNAGNWKLSASAEQLTNKKKTESLDSSVSYLFKTILKQYENEDDTLPPSNDIIFPPTSEQSESVSLTKDIELPTDGFTVDIMKATNSPDGRYVLELEKTQLKIPKEVKTDRTTYNGNITWILSDTI